MVLCVLTCLVMTTMVSSPDNCVQHLMSRSVNDTAHLYGTLCVDLSGNDNNGLITGQLCTASDVKVCH